MAGELFGWELREPKRFIDKWMEQRAGSGKRSRLRNGRTGLLLFWIFEFLRGLLVVETTCRSQDGGRRYVRNVYSMYKDDSQSGKM